MKLDGKYMLGKSSSYVVMQRQAAASESANNNWFINQNNNTRSITSDKVYSEYSNEQWH